MMMIPILAVRMSTSPPLYPVRSFSSYSVYPHPLRHTPPPPNPVKRKKKGRKGKIQNHFPKPSKMRENTLIIPSTCLSSHFILLSSFIITFPPFPLLIVSPLHPHPLAPSLNIPPFHLNPFPKCASGLLAEFPKFNNIGRARTHARSAVSKVYDNLSQIGKGEGERGR